MLACCSCHQGSKTESCTKLFIVEKLNFVKLCAFESSWQYYFDETINRTKAYNSFKGIGFLRFNLFLPWQQNKIKSEIYAFYY